MRNRWRVTCDSNLVHIGFGSSNIEVCWGRVWMIQTHVDFQICEEDTEIFPWGISNQFHFMGFEKQYYISDSKIAKGIHQVLFIILEKIYWVLCYLNDRNHKKPFRSSNHKSEWRLCVMWHTISMHALWVCKRTTCRKHHPGGLHSFHGNPWRKLCD